MANYSTLISQINAYVKQNGNKLITGQGLQTILDAMVVSLGNGFQFIGVATIKTEPGTPDQNVFYLAFGPGTFTNFGGEELLDGEVALFFYTGSWSAVKLNLATKTAVQALAEDLNTLAAAVQDKVDKVPGKGLSTNDFTNEMKALVQSALQSDIIKQALGSDAGAVISQAAITQILGDYALKDGYYQTLIAGLSENLIGRGSVVQKFNRRPTAGTLDVGGPAAEIKALRGNSIVWNQMVNAVTSTFDECTLTKNDDGSYTVSGIPTVDAFNALTSLIAAPGHKIYFNLEIISGDGIIIYDANNTIAAGGYMTASAKSIYTANENVRFYLIRLAAATQDAKFRLTVTDLTLMFGEGKEPTTVAEFEALYSQSYYAHDTGTIKNVTATGLLTNGFNQWDEEWEVGDIDNQGQPQPATSVFRSKNYIQVFSSTNYNIHYGSSSSGSILYYYFYDSNKQFISSGSSSALDKIIVTPSNAAYMKIRSGGNNAQRTYNHDICINLSHSGYRNGEYEPYWKSTLQLNLNNLACHDENDNAVVVNGLDGVGTAYDEGVVENGMLTKIIKRRDRYTFTGEEHWIKKTGLVDSTKEGFHVSLNFLATTRKNSGITDKYPNEYASGTSSNPSVIIDNIPDKSFGLADGNATYPLGNMMVVRDSACATTDAMAAAMTGVEFDYELATPVVLTLDTPIPMSYRVDDFGTENKVPADTANDVSAPLVIDVAYPMNAVDILRNMPKRYISVDSQVELLEAMKSAGKIAGYTMTWDATTGKYKYIIS